MLRPKDRLWTSSLSCVDIDTFSFHHDESGIDCLSLQLLVGLAKGLTRQADGSSLGSDFDAIE